MRLSFLLLPLCCSLLLGCPSPEEPREGLTLGGQFYLYWGAVPEPIPFNEPFQLAVMTHDGADYSVMVADTELSVDAAMPTHGHGMNTVAETTANGDGSFVVDGMLFHMPGEWRIDMVVTQGDIEDAVSFDVACCE